MLEQTSEALLLFGGLTALLLLPVCLVVPLSENDFGIAIIMVWILVWVACSLFFMRGSRTRRVQLIVLVVASSISLVQAALGFLMILGKSV